MTQTFSSLSSMGLTCSGSNNQVLLQNSGPISPNFVGQIPCMVHVSALGGIAQVWDSSLFFHSLQTVAGHSWVKTSRSKSWPAVILFNIVNPNSSLISFVLISSRLKNMLTLLFYQHRNSCVVLIKIVYQVKRTSKPGMRNSVPISTRL